MLHWQRMIISWPRQIAVTFVSIWKYGGASDKHKFQQYAFDVPVCRRRHYSKHLWRRVRKPNDDGHKVYAEYVCGDVRYLADNSR